MQYIVLNFKIIFDERQNHNVNGKKIKNLSVPAGWVYNVSS